MPTPSPTLSPGTGPVGQFLTDHFGHFNARETLAAAQGWAEHHQRGGKMLVSLAGAMSTARIGPLLHQLIQRDAVHAISTTGANLEEDLFNLLAYREYERIPDWRALRAEDEQALLERGMNRVTDTCIPETVMRNLEAHLFEHWLDACKNDQRKTPAQFLFDVIRSGKLEPHQQLPSDHSWMVAAAEKDIPVFTPGWEDSTTGNMFAAWVATGQLPHHHCVSPGTEQMQQLMHWYQQATSHINPAVSNESQPGVGFFQIGGGIAGDFAICAVPAIIQDLKQDVPYWSYFAQISDAQTSYGGYSGAVPNEKITWGKLDVHTPKYMIQSDATIVAPLIFAYLLGQ